MQTILVLSRSGHTEVRWIKGVVIWGILAVGLVHRMRALAGVFHNRET